LPNLRVPRVTVVIAGSIMRKPIRVVASIAGFAAAIAAFTPAASAGVIDKAEAAAKPVPPGGTWLAWGGQTRFHLNPDELDRLGVRVARVDGAASRTEGEAGVRYEVTAFPALDASGLEINHTGRVISGIGGGALRHAGGYVLAWRGGTIDLRGFALRASPDTRIGLDIVDASGVVWFTADHAHYGFEDRAPNIFSMRHMNLRLSAHFAAVLGRPELAGDPVGGLDFSAHSYEGEKSTLAEQGTCTAPWPDPPSTTGDVLLIYDNAASGWTGFDDSIYIKRCQGCTTSSTTGKLIVNQDSSLRNAGTTAVAWLTKFQGICSQDFPGCPYNSDQHPFLVWSTYRIDADGRIKQIGVSGVKHAFYTVNWNCQPDECPGGNIIWPTCEDTYSNFNNDSSSDLGPRSEIIPYTGQWGRCGSVYDANCDGNEDSDGGARTLYDDRENVVESELEAPLAAGARYLHEYWYIVRDDHAIYNSMGWREVSFAKNGANWSVDLVGDQPNGADFHVGPALSQWVDPDAPPANAANQELSTPLGRARIAVKATDLGGGQWRYEYAVQNYDYAHAQIDAAHPDEPNLKVDSNHGFARFSVPVGAGAVISGLRFDDTDTNATNDWSAATAGGSLTWTAPAGNSLDWGTMYHFEFVAAGPPSSGTVQLVGIATASEPELPYTLDILVPPASNDTIFENGFD
jgi:hypothetical protein